MEIEKSRNGFYTVTFINKNNKNIKDISKEFSTVGNVVHIVQNYQRIFIRFTEKEEAERAINKFGKVYDLTMAKNNKPSDNTNYEGNLSHNRNHFHKNHHTHAAPPTLESSNISESMEKLNPNGKIFNLILGNLPKNYTVKDVNDLVAEAKPVNISEIDETRALNIKFCHIVLDRAENLTYLIDKLNGFVICGEKLIAAEVGHLLEWREKAPQIEIYFEKKIKNRTKLAKGKSRKLVPS